MIQTIIHQKKQSEMLLEQIRESDRAEGQERCL